ncbi:translation initiation factor IF-2, partial [bacterium]
GYQNRDGASTGGGYQGRNPNQTGGYQNRDGASTGGGYQGRNPNQTGGYQNRDGASTGGGYQGQNPNPAGTGGYQNRTDGGYKAPVKLFTINDKNKSTTGFDPNDPKKPRTQPFDNKKSFGLPVKSDGTAPEAGKKRPDNKKKDASGYKKKSIEEERLLAKASINKRKKKEEKKEEVVEENLNKEIEIFDGMNVKDVADKLRIKETDIIRELFMKKMMVTVNQSLDLETIEKIVLDHGFTIKAAVNKDDEILEQKLEELMAEVDTELVSRPPVVTIMGHVDHGKTSLLDSIRKTKITEGEAGGITQHIGAYQVHVQDRLITFLDTPGHEAFTAMRARGARSTDIAVLVVAADDGIMPQTIEAINHAKAASVPIIVAINKMDKVDANPDRVKQQLAEHDLVPEDWGGTTVTVPVSARAKTGIDDLLDMIILTADIQDIKANPNKPAQGVIIESKLDKGKGAVATVLIQAGTLKIGDNFVVGTVYGKVRAMFDYLGKQVKEAALSAPVQVIGYSAVPVAGETFKVVGSDKEAREIAEKALELEKEKSLSPVRAINLESISEQIGEGKVKELNLVVKADVQGSYEALAQSLMKIAVEDVKLRIIHSAVGDVTENDITLAAASSGIVVAFNVKIEPKARDMAEKELVDIRSYNIIYRVIEDVQKALEGLLEPELEEVLTGKAEVRAIFTVGKTSVVAGCYVLEGKIARNSTIKLVRDGQTIHTGKIDALKRFKDDVKEVSTGFEFGISLEKSNDIKEKDIMEAYIMQAKPRN